MSSRREEKERRRAERLAAEEEAAKAEARRRTVGIAVGVVLGAAAVAAIVVAVTAGGGGGDDGEGPSATGRKVPIPAQKITDVRAAASAAGCRLRSFTPGPRDRQHVTTPVRYRQNPPVFGPHDPTWASDGNYAGQGTPATEKLVHALEHGRVLIQYKPGLEQRRVAQLETLFNERPKPGVIPGYNTLLVENRTGMPFAIAATSWGQQLGCPQFNDQVFDALRAFRTAYVDKGPEFIPTPE